MASPSSYEEKPADSKRRDLRRQLLDAQLYEHEAVDLVARLAAIEGDTTGVARWGERYIQMKHFGNEWLVVGALPMDIQ